MFAGTRTEARSRALEPESGVDDRAPGRDRANGTTLRAQAPAQASAFAGAGGAAPRSMQSLPWDAVGDPPASLAIPQAGASAGGRSPLGDSLEPVARTRREAVPSGAEVPARPGEVSPPRNPKPPANPRAPGNPKPGTVGPPQDQRGKAGGGLGGAAGANLRDERLNDEIDGVRAALNNDVTTLAELRGSANTRASLLERVASSQNQGAESAADGAPDAAQRRTAIDASTDRLHRLVSLTTKTDDPNAPPPTLAELARRLERDLAAMPGTSESERKQLERDAWTILETEREIERLERRAGEAHTKLDTLDDSRDAAAKDTQNAIARLARELGISMSEAATELEKPSSSISRRLAHEIELQTKLAADVERRAADRAGRLRYGADRAIADQAMRDARHARDRATSVKASIASLRHDGVRPGTMSDLRAAATAAKKAAAIAKSLARNARRAAQYGGNPSAAADAAARAAVVAHATAGVADAHLSLARVQANPVSNSVAQAYLELKASAGVAGALAGLADANDHAAHATSQSDESEAAHTIALLMKQAAQDALNDAIASGAMGLEYTEWPDCPDVNPPDFVCPQPCPPPRVPQPHYTTSEDCEADETKPSGVKGQGAEAARAHGYALPNAPVAPPPIPRLSAVTGSRTGPRREFDPDVIEERPTVGPAGSHIQAMVAGWDAGVGGGAPPAGPPRESSNKRSEKAEAAASDEDKRIAQAADSLAATASEFIEGAFGRFVKELLDGRPEREQSEIFDRLQAFYADLVPALEAAAEKDFAAMSIETAIAVMEVEGGDDLDPVVLQALRNQATEYRFEAAARRFQAARRVVGFEHLDKADLLTTSAATMLLFARQADEAVARAAGVEFDPKLHSVYLQRAQLLPGMERPMERGRHHDVQTRFPRVHEARALYESVREFKLLDLIDVYRDLGGAGATDDQIAQRLALQYAMAIVLAPVKGLVMGAKAIAKLGPRALKILDLALDVGGAVGVNYAEAFIVSSGDAAKQPGFETLVNSLAEVGNERAVGGAARASKKLVVAAAVFLSKGRKGGRAPGVRLKARPNVGAADGASSGPGDAKGSTTSATPKSPPPPPPKPPEIPPGNPPRTFGTAAPPDAPSGGGTPPRPKKPAGGDGGVESGHGPNEKPRAPDGGGEPGPGGVDRRRRSGGVPAERPFKVSPARRTHILDGDGPNSGGHRWGQGRPKKTEFPHWASDDQIIKNAERIANDPASYKARVLPTGPDRVVAQGHMVGPNGEVVIIRVVVEPAGEGIITAHPTSLPRNPLGGW